MKIYFGLSNTFAFSKVYAIMSAVGKEVFRLTNARPRVPPLRVSHLSRMLISQSSNIWDFHVSWCRFVTRDTDNHSDRTHRHSLYELQVTLQGSLSIFLSNEDPQIIHAGEWLIIPPQAPHHLQFSKPGTEKLVIGFSVKKMTPSLISAFSQGSWDIVRQVSPSMLKMIDILQDKSNETQQLTPHIISFLIQGIVLESLNIISSAFDQRETDMWKNSTNDVFVDKANQYIQDHVSYAVSSQEVADYLGISLRHLNRLYHVACGHSIYSQIQQARVAHAQILLETTSMSLSDIAESMEYSSVYAFIRAFKNICGVTPGKFQRDAAAR